MYQASVRRAALTATIALNRHSWGPGDRQVGHELREGARGVGAERWCVCGAGCLGEIIRLASSTGILIRCLGEIIGLDSSSDILPQ